MAEVIETLDVDEWEILSDDGWHDLTHIHKTIEYDVWEVQTDTHTLRCADTHIVINTDKEEVYVEDLVVGDSLITDTGIESVISVSKLDMPPEHMYDVTVDSESHTLFTNGILSHNSTMSSVYLLHFMLFNKDKVVAILANKESSAQEVLRRVKAAYGMLPLWMQQGIRKWNEKSIELENGMRMIANTTSSDSISGETVSLLYLDEFAKVKSHIAEEFITATLPVVSSGKTSKVIIVSCVTDESFVLTPSGIKEVSDFVDYTKPEDGSVAYEVNKYQVMGHDGVKDGTLMCNSGLSETTIITSPYSRVECSLRHPWFVCDNGKYDWKKTKDLSGNEYVAIEYGHDVWGDNDSIPLIDIDDYMGSRVNDYRIETINEDFAYFLGLYIAEGSARCDTGIYRQICITCGDYVGDVFSNLGWKYHLHDDGLHYTISSTILCGIMMSLGFDLSRTAKCKIIPKRLFEMSRKNIIAMIQGIMDGDGSSQKNKGVVCISTSSKRLMEQMRALFNNFGILTSWTEGVHLPTKLCKVESKFYRIELNKTMSKKYYDIIGFRFNRKQLNEQYLPENITRDRCDIIPYSKDIIIGLKYTYPDDYKKIVDHGIMKGNYKKIPHFNRMFMLRHKDFLLGLNNPILNYLLEYVHENIKWEPIHSIIKSQAKVYDFSLNETGDKWCHSVLYNNILGHQTPVGMNHFYSYWRGANEIDPKLANNFFPIKVNWWDHPYRDEAWKEEVLKTFNNDIAKFNQEYNCRFLGSSDTLIDPETLEKMVIRQPIDSKWNHALSIYENPEDNAIYVLGIDTGKGTGRDYSVVQVLRINGEHDIKQVAVYRENMISPHEFAQVCIGISKFYNNAQMMIENNGIGEALTQAIWYEYEYDNIINLDPKGLGIRSTTKTKLQANLLLKRYIDEKFLELKHEHTILELSKYVEIRPNVFQAETSSTHDDCVTSLLWALYFIETPYFDSDSLEMKTIDDQYDLTNSGPIMFLPD